MFYVYVLKSVSADKTYVGFTEDVERRFKEHNAGKSNYTSKYVPWRLVYKEECKDRIAARVKEKYYKSAAGRRALKKIIENN